MATYFHVTGADYVSGEPLMCFDLLEECGYGPTWKWDCDYIDTDVVCLFENEADARAFIAVFAPNGKLLRVDIPDTDTEVRFTVVDEGYKAAYRMIPAKYITEIA